MGKLLAVLYGVVSYALFFGVFLYAIAFIEGLPVPKTLDSGEAGPLLPSLLIDTALLGVFAIQHSVMARPAFKTWWTRMVPKAVERSTYVLFSTLALALVVWQWRPAPTIVWSVTGPAALALTALSYVGFLVLLTSTFLINHFDLFGLRQVFAYASGREIPPSDFTTPLFYRVVRHPLYLGFIIGFWAAPVMSVGHLFFAAGSTAYILIAIQFEEHDLVNVFGDTYRGYQKRVSMILPWLPSTKG
ncbi:MAG TPA: isoprenylcysteine carboxylmethyltransferase family protein [Phenylobacterium sp.]|jgi:protein-S-isoprenylcysteine O-methyltransferase Ste14